MMAGEEQPHVAFLTGALRETEGRAPPDRRQSSGAGPTAHVHFADAGGSGTPGMYQHTPARPENPFSHQRDARVLGSAPARTTRLPVPDIRTFEGDHLFHLHSNEKPRRPTAPAKPRKTPSSSVRHVRGSSGEFIGAGGLSSGRPSRAGDVESWVPEGYSAVSVLGDGAFSRVWRVMDQQGGEFALKSLVKRGRSGNRDLVDAQKEFAVGFLLSAYGHPNVVRYFECHSEYVAGIPVFGLRLELCSRTLASLQLHELDVNVVVKFLVDSALGLDYMHRSGFLHIDVKPPNMLLGADGQTVKLSDFGLAVPIETVSSDHIDIPEGDKLYYGSEWHGELDHVHDIGPPSDVFSLGLSFLEISTSVTLPDRGELYNALRNAEFGMDPQTQLPLGPISFVRSKLDEADAVRLPHLPQEFDELLRKMLQPLPRDRATLDELLSDPLCLAFSAQNPALAIPVDVNAVAHYRERVAQMIPPESPPTGLMMSSPELQLHLSQGDALEEAEDDAAVLRRVSFGSACTDDEVMGDDLDPSGEEDLLGISTLSRVAALPRLNPAGTSPALSPLLSHRPGPRGPDGFS